MTFARLRALFRSRQQFTEPSLVEQYRRVWKVEHPNPSEAPVSWWHPFVWGQFVRTSLLNLRGQ